jgi:Cu(I)/Ag(I) efflux system periplasmic protein CusF
MNKLSILLATLLFSLAAFGQVAGNSQDKGGSAGAKPDKAFVEGEVRRLDKGAGKITLKHGPIANLDMPSMSMVFVVKDRAMLDRVKEGDTVRFKADKIQGAYTVTEIEIAK